MRSHEPFQNESAYEIDLCHLKQGCMHVHVHVYMCKGTYRRSGNFHRQNISLVKLSCSLIFVAYANVRNT
jgi:hypothetical protein